MKMEAGFEVNKRSAGVFLTEGNPFGYDAVRRWLERALESAGEEVSICEPYAGEGGLLRYLEDEYSSLFEGHAVEWEAYDIEPPSLNKFPQAPVVKKNTLFSLPRRYDIIVTNPPYLARNSARRRHLDFPFDYAGDGISSPQDLYQIALDTCLRDAAWVCFLIPESFITSKYSKSRLMDVISLPGDLFAETDCPVCLALFGPDDTDDFTIYNQSGKSLGSYSELSATSRRILGGEESDAFSFNIPDGIIGLRGVDNTVSPSIRFVRGDEIAPEKVKETSRAITRISTEAVDGKNLDDVIRKANSILDEWRRETNDVFLTAFKGVRKDGRYRRRLSYDIAARILSRACSDAMRQNEGEI